jgi:predicted amidohydrolase
MALVAALASCCIVGSGYGQPFNAEDIKPPGPYWPLDERDHSNAETFESGEPVVGTTYFYWYDVYSGAHIRNPDGTDALTTHPPADRMANMSYKSPSWHLEELRDACEAGLDFIMPVFWGAPGEYEAWSFTGLGPLVEAHDRLAAERKSPGDRTCPPKIAMFYDTSTLKFKNQPEGKPWLHIDLTTPQGQQFFYATIRDFFSMIPPAKWARVDGKPIVFLYSASFAKNIDDTLFEYVRDRFEEDFGTGLFIVRHRDWPGTADAWYTWGGALGLKVGDKVAAVGPGYDHSAVRGREPLVVHRQGGAFYRQQWEKLLRMNPDRRPWMVHVETWNEWHEGTNIARSREHGKQYIEMTRKYADIFRAGTQLPKEGPYAEAERVRWAGLTSQGLSLRESEGDGHWKYQKVNNHQTVINLGPDHEPSGRYIYYQIDDSYLYDEINANAEVRITFLDDASCDSFYIEYDSSKMSAQPFSGAFAKSPEVSLTHTGHWRTVALPLPDVRFANRTNTADFRIVPAGRQGQLVIREVVVTRRPDGSRDEPEARDLSRELALQRSSMKAMQVACVQLDISDSITTNADRIIESLRSESERGTRLVAFPECALTSYDTDIIAGFSQDDISAELERIRQACNEFDIYGVIGSPYREDAKWYNGAYVFGPAGQLVKRYTKLHVVKPSFFEDGNELAIFYVDDVPTTIMICHDERYPEIFRIPVLAGAKVGIYISCESKTPAKWDNYRCQIIARAVENQISVIHCNSGDGGADGGSHGHSRIIGPKGKVLAEASQNIGETIRAAIDPSRSSTTHAKRGAGTPSLRAFWDEAIRVLREQNPEFFELQVPSHP